MLRKFNLPRVHVSLIGVSCITCIWTRFALAASLLLENLACPSRRQDTQQLLTLLRNRKHCHHVGCSTAAIHLHLLITHRFLLRRSAVRAISATPTKAFLATPRSITTLTPAFRAQSQKWTVSAFQRRFASDDIVKKEEVAAETPEDFAQTIAEPITEDGLTPVQQNAQAEPTNAAETVGVDALESAAQATEKPRRAPREKSDAPPNNTLYVGNLYYEVTADQIKRVMSRFGEVENVKIVFDNRGLSRG